jgi:hypothetical protein
MGDQARCWCGSTDLTAFSPDYLVCGDCGTLVAVAMFCLGFGIGEDLAREATHESTQREERQDDDLAPARNR